MICHMYKGAFIPGCMGAAAACGCGKSLAEIKAYCTCPRKKKVERVPDNTDPVIERIDKLEQRLARIEALLERRRAKKTRHAAT